MALPPLFARRPWRLVRTVGLALVGASCAGADGGAERQGPGPARPVEPAASRSAAVATAGNSAASGGLQDEALAGTGTDVRTVASVVPCPAPRIVLPELVAFDGDPPVPPIAEAERLASFFEAAARIFRGTATDHVRIAVYGDSNLTMDYQTGQIRRRLQAAYGDAGHGFVALGRPWSHYQHMDVRHGVGGGYVSYAASTDPIWDRVYGLGGISAESRYGGAKTWVATADSSSPIGRTASRFEIYYARGPSWGRFEIRVDGKMRAEVESHAPALALGVERIEVEDGPHELACVSTDERRPVRLLGATLERATPGFVVDSFGVGALNSRAHAAEEPTINQAMLRERRYDLVIFATGANDVFTLDEAPRHMRRLIDLHREALPTTPILLLTPADRGERDTFGPTLLAVEQRAAIARDNGCALWDQFAAMGGRGSMKRLGRHGLVHPDYIHFNRAGGAYIGDRLLHALMVGASEYLRAHPEAGCAIAAPRDEALAQYSSQKK